MLEWKYDEKSSHHLGFADGVLLYRVFFGEGWEWEEASFWEGGYGYDTPEEAMQAANVEWQKRTDLEDRLLLIDLEITLEELEEIHWDEVAHERMEMAKGCIKD